MRCAAGIVILSLLAADASAQGAPRRVEILTVTINDVSAGEHIIYFEGTDALVPVEVLRLAGLAVRAATTSIEGVPYVAVAAAALKYVLDEEHLTLRLSARATQLPDVHFDLRATQTPADIQHREATSLYLNYGVHLHDRAATGFAETGLRFGDSLAYSSVAMLDDHTVVRGLSSLTFEDRKRLVRIVEGDHLVNGGPLAGGAVIGGLHVIRSFELDPYVLTAPGIDLAGSVLAPSTADIYVNGVLVKRQQLAPGRYTFENLPVSTGSSDTRVVLRDALGREQEISRGFYTARNLLAPGLTDYHVAAGAIRERVGLESFDYGSAVTIARFRRGLTRHVTAGVRADVTPEQAGTGASIALGLPFGQVDAALGVSNDRGTTGAAASLAWGYSSRRASLSLYGHRVGTRYATLEIPREGDRAITEARILASLAVHRRVSTGLQLGTSEFRDRGWSDRFSVNANASLWRSTAVSVAAGSSNGAQQSRTYDLMLNLNVGIGNRTRAALAHHRRTGGERTTAQVERAMTTGTSVGYRALAEIGDGSRASASVQAQTSTGRYEVAYAYDEQAGGSADLSVAGGVAVIGGRVFASRPIDGSFGLVRVPGVRGVRVSLENQPLGRTDANGDLFIPNLQPRYGNIIGISAIDLPLDRHLPLTRQVIAPPTAGGVVVTFAAVTLHVVRGTLRIATAAGATTPAYGELTIAASPTPFVSPISGDGKFELEGVLAGRHAASIEWEGGTCKFELVVPALDRPLLDLGQVHCAPDNNNRRTP